MESTNGRLLQQQTVVFYKRKKSSFKKLKMIVEIDISTVLYSANGSAVPPNLAGYLDQNQWNAITNSIRAAHSQATLMTCLLEWACCFVFAFPCIFFGHPCFVEMTAQDTIRTNLRQLNSTYFNGVDVLSSIRAGTFTVNTDKIIRAPPGAQVLYLQQQPVLVSPVYLQPEQTYAQPGQSYAQPVQAFAQPGQTYAQPPPPSAAYGVAAQAYETAVPVSASPQSQFILTIPPGAHPGSILSVVNPQGVPMQVTVPPGAQPGSQILLKY